MVGYRIVKPYHFKRIYAPPLAAAEERKVKLDREETLKEVRRGGSLFLFPFLVWTSVLYDVFLRREAGGWGFWHAQFQNCFLAGFIFFSLFRSILLVLVKN